jgi:colicin import membrane protein
LEAHLLEQEKFKEVREKEKKDELRRVRAEQLAPYVENPAVFDFANMPEDTFQMVLNGSIKSKNDKIEAEKQVERDRLAKIEEDKRIRAENEALRLKNEAITAQIESEAKQMREKQEAVLRKLKEEEARKKAESDKLLKEAKEREAKLAKELKDRQEAEEKARADAEKKRKADERKSRLAPDKDKLVLLTQQITDLKMPEVKSEEAKKVVGDILIMINKLVKFINEKIPNL